MSDETLDRSLFTPPRFKVLGFLVQVEESDYPSIQEFTGLSTPDISRAVSYLDDARLVRVRKELKGRYPYTVVQATDVGRRRFKALISSLKKYGVGG